MRFSEYKQLNELEDAYDTEKTSRPSVTKLNELRHQIRREMRKAMICFTFKRKNEL